MKSLILFGAAASALLLMNFSKPIKHYSGQSFIDKDSSEVKEFMEWSEVRFDGKTYMISSKSKIKKLCGPKDSVVEFLSIDLGCGHYFDRNFYQHSTDGCQFEQAGDSMVFMQMSFPEAGKHFLKYRKMKFGASTMLYDLQHYFPLSAAHPEKKKTDDGKTYDVVYVPAASKNSENNFAFYFENNKLKMIRYWIPC